MPDPILPPPFRCTIAETGDGGARIRPSGELDMRTTPILDARMREAQQAGFRRLVVDLRALEFMDSTGLSLLTRWSLESERDGFSLALIQGRDRIQRLFDITGLTSHFDFLDG